MVTVLLLAAGSIYIYIWLELYRLLAGIQRVGGHVSCQVKVLLWDEAEKATM